jgi:hypothetical protein
LAQKKQAFGLNPELPGAAFDARPGLVPASPIMGASDISFY